MARKEKVVVEVLDDLDGTELDANTKPLRFAVGGEWREIYLSEKNLEKFNKALAPFVEVSTKVTNNGNGGRGRVSSGPSPKEVRLWAIEQDPPLLEPDSRGRIPAHVQEKYDAAH